MLIKIATNVALRINGDARKHECHIHYNINVPWSCEHECQQRLPPDVLWCSRIIVTVFHSQSVLLLNMIHQAFVISKNFEEESIIFMFVSQLPSNILTFPFRCLSKNSENQSRIKILVSCTRSRETAVLFWVSCCLRRRLPRSLHQRDVGDSFSC
jgi:hypothetical protein